MTSTTDTTEQVGLKVQAIVGAITAGLVEHAKAHPFRYDWAFTPKREITGVAKYTYSVMRRSGTWGVFLTHVPTEAMQVANIVAVLTGGPRPDSATANGWVSMPLTEVLLLHQIEFLEHSAHFVESYLKHIAKREAEIPGCLEKGDEAIRLLKGLST
jgi:hypothetical protein